MTLPARKRDAEETKTAPVELEAPPVREKPPPACDDRWLYGESFDAYDRRHTAPVAFRPRRTPSPAVVVVKEPPSRFLEDPHAVIAATPVPPDPLPEDPYARATASSAATRRSLAATPRRKDYEKLHEEREAYERHVRSLMAKKARKDAARASVALAAHERTVDRASKRKAEVDSRRALAARTAERRQRRGSTSPAPDVAARTARSRAAPISPAPPALAARPAERRDRTPSHTSDVAARTEERRRRAGR